MWGPLSPVQAKNDGKCQRIHILFVITLPEEGLFFVFYAGVSWRALELSNTHIAGETGLMKMSHSGGGESPFLRIPSARLLFRPHQAFYNLRAHSMCSIAKQADDCSFLLAIVKLSG